MSACGKLKEFDSLFYCWCRGTCYSRDTWVEEELGRHMHKGREGKVECTLCGTECESVMYVLWESLTYRSCRLEILEKLLEIGINSDFDTLGNLEKISYMY